MNKEDEGKTMQWKKEYREGRRRRKGRSREGIGRGEEGDHYHKQ